MNTTPETLEAVRVTRALLGSLSGAGDRAAQIEIIEELRALQAACAAAMARVSVGFAVDRVTESQQRGESIEKQHRSAVSELALAHRCSPASMSTRLSQYRRLVRDLPGVLRVLASGESSEYAAMSVAKASHSLTAEDAERLDREISPHLSGWTPRHAEGRVNRFCQQVDPQSAVRRLQKSEREAHVSIRPVADGMARLSILSPTAKAVGMYAALRRDAMTAPGSDQTLGQRMSGLAFARITGLESAEEMAIEIQLVMSADTLIGSNAGEPARLADALGSAGTDAWLPASIAKDLALGKHHPEAARWIRRLFTDPVTGTLHDVDSKRRYFTPAMRRHIQLRDQVCTTPWCDAPIRHIDHAVPHGKDGPTTLANGNGKCERCNYVKEHPGWKTEPIKKRSGGIAITTPTGKRYTGTSPPVLAALQNYQTAVPRPTIVLDLQWAS